MIDSIAKQMFYVDRMCGYWWRFLFFQTRLQLLHCNSHTGTGGENVFVDGFYVAEQLRMNDPEAFNFLATTKIPSHYYVSFNFFNLLQSLPLVSECIPHFYCTCFYVL